MDNMSYILECIKIMFTSLSVFDAIVYLILLLLTIYVAWKTPGKISAIGKIIVIMTAFCVIVDINILITQIMIKSPTLYLAGNKSEILYNLIGQYPELRDAIKSDFMSVMVYDLASVAGSVVIGCLTYIINNIIYIIRTPRI